MSKAADSMRRACKPLAAGMVLAGIMLAACGGAKTDQVELLRSEVFSLKQDQRQLQHSISSLDSLIRSRVEALDNFRASFSSDVRTLNQRLNVLEQRLDDTERRMISLQGRIGGGGAPAPGGQAPSGGQDQETGSGGQQGISPGELFDIAYRDFTAANYQLAIDGFRDFLDKFPDNPRAAEVYFYLGSSHEAMKKYDEAIESYRTIVERYADSPQHPDALYKIGDCLMKMGNRSRAETYFQTVVQRFPDSNAAALARSRMNP